jgi:5-methylcytosine-specific restriction endonuclease McrA
MSRRAWFGRGRRSPAPSRVSGPQQETRLSRGYDPPSSSRSTANSTASADERRSRAIAQDVKIEVAARDGGRCRQCGSNKELHFDHVTPWSKGGANTADNIQLLCGTCNRRKGADDIPATLPPSPYRQAWRSRVAHAQSAQSPVSHGPTRSTPDTSEQRWEPICPDCGKPSALHTGARCPGGR